MAARDPAEDLKANGIRMAAALSGNPLPPVRHVLADHAADISNLKATSADHGARLDALDGGPDTGGLADDGGGHDDAGYVSGDGT